MTEAAGLVRPPGNQALMAHRARWPPPEWGYPWPECSEPGAELWTFAPVAAGGCRGSPDGEKAKFTAGSLLSTDSQLTAVTLPWTPDLFPHPPPAGWGQDQSWLGRRHLPVPLKSTSHRLLVWAPGGGLCCAGPHLPPHAPTISHQV